MIYVDECLSIRSEPDTVSIERLFHGYEVRIQYPNHKITRFFPFSSEEKNKIAYANALDFQNLVIRSLELDLSKE